MLSFEITDEITADLKKFNELAVEKALRIRSLKPDARDAMARYARISNIGSTTRIENAVLTDPEIGWMDETLERDARPTAFIKEKRYIEDKLSKQKERSIEEVAGCRQMLLIVFSQASELFPLSEATIKGLNRELLQYYPPASPYMGKYKVVPNNVVEIMEGTDVRKDVLKTADPGPITEAAMHDLVRWYNAEIRSHPWSVAVASELVFRFLAIHPFQDGNGRIGRALFNLALLQSDETRIAEVLPYIAIDRHIERNKGEYYMVLRRCSEGKFCQDPKEYRIGYFVRFMLRMLTDALESDVDFYAERYEKFNALSDAQRTVLAAFRERPEERLGLKDVLSEIDMPRRTAIHALSALSDDGFIQKTGRGPATKYRLAF